MDEVDETGSDGVSSGTMAMVALGLAFAIFVVVPATRPVVLVVLWVLAPVVAYGTLYQVFSGDVDLLSARSIFIALVCGMLAVALIPLGFLVVDETFADGLQFGGFVAALVAIGFARISVTDDVTPSGRYVPPLDPSEFVDEDETE